MTDQILLENILSLDSTRDALGLQCVDAIQVLTTLFLAFLVFCFTGVLPFFLDEDLRSFNTLPRQGVAEVGDDDGNLSWLVDYVAVGA